MHRVSSVMEGGLKRIIRINANWLTTQIVKLSVEFIKKTL